MANNRKRNQHLYWALGLLLLATGAHADKVASFSLPAGMSVCGVQVGPLGGIALESRPEGNGCADRPVSEAAERNGLKLLDGRLEVSGEAWSPEQPQPFSWPRFRALDVSHAWPGFDFFGTRLEDGPLQVHLLGVDGSVWVVRFGEAPRLVDRFDPPQGWQPVAIEAVRHGDTVVIARAGDGSQTLAAFYYEQ